ncbi:MAG TPA: helix-turn-helix domain-containing protein [Aeromicrobium sp.]|nr:helix-turn-helix domain-containing protein [Aeromicrobium sp.]HKY57722.1 helix-turn-helix domain-containing protein [Aeromicrobium sp.]
MYSARVRGTALELLASGASVSAVSRAVGATRSTIRSWRDDPGTVGRRECPHCDGSRLDPAAYACLLGFYLGDGCISAAARCHVLRISCDAKLPGIVADVEAAVRGVRPTATIHLVPGPGVTVVQSAWKHWPCLFPQDGDGPKHKRLLALSGWQSRIVEQEPAAFLRGLFHSDGACVANWAPGPAGKRYEYPRWQFSNRSEDIHAMCQWALDLVGIDWRRSNRWSTSVSRRDAVARLDRLIGLKS